MLVAFLVIFSITTWFITNLQNVYFSQSLRILNYIWKQIHNVRNREPFDVSTSFEWRKCRQPEWLWFERHQKSNNKESIPLIQSNWSQQFPGYPVASFRTRLRKPTGQSWTVHLLFGLHVHLRTTEIFSLHDFN